MKRSATLLVFSLVMHNLLLAGDLGNFANLGFSPDSSTFSFASYGVRSDDVPYADIYLVDVAKNRFTPDGQFRHTGNNPVSLGQDGTSSLFKLLGNSWANFQKAGIDPELQGRLIYVLLDGASAQDSLSFKDFNTDTTYDIEMVQSMVDEGAKFHIELKYTRPGKSPESLTIGIPTLIRKHVVGYRIRQIILAPNEKNLIFVIEKNMTKEARTGSEFMVEAIAIR